MVVACEMAMVEPAVVRRDEVVRLCTREDCHRLWGHARPTFCPLRLNQHTFLQLAFNALKDRCVASHQVRDVVALHRFVCRYLVGIAAYSARRSAAAPVAPSRGVPKAMTSVGTRGRIRADARTTQPVASHDSHRRSVATAAAQPTSNDVAAGRAAAAEVRPVMSADEFRVQLRAEYGVDVYSDAAVLASSPGARDDPAAALLPHELTEEEFYAQLGRPSALAQECCVM
jgi:hypothetical protein